jgi:hypothetical protein
MDRAKAEFVIKHTRDIYMNIVAQEMAHIGSEMKGPGPEEVQTAYKLISDAVSHFYEAEQAFKETI